jgi:hypothetical protein
MSVIVFFPQIMLALFLAPAGVWGAGSNLN